MKAPLVTLAANLFLALFIFLFLPPPVTHAEEPFFKRGDIIALVGGAAAGDSAPPRRAAGHCAGR